MGVPAQSSGRLLERLCKQTPRGMIVHDRTRLIDQLGFFLLRLDRTFSVDRTFNSSFPFLSLFF
ncbi:hypothetical protein SAMN05660772_01707 [Pasteurella testudinis DSM 23072]|uniref:Uncharacterized protein n=1 Tax=Pasteurella testudinis DSM 23072 TaxID=1122938 RepID=A0A1W1UI75_9PAST|nr:hypothetical protein SAMN05660772_01707 [Pasteurella testudinis DSM 23072]